MAKINGSIQGSGERDRLSYSLASPEECKLMTAFVQINLSQFAVRSCGEWSRLQQGDDSQISFIFFIFNPLNPLCKFEDGI